MSVSRRISELACQTLLAGCLTLGPVAAQAKNLPRVVSMNLCTDQLALLLADPEQIISLSRLATDPRSSSLAKEAQAYPLNSGQAEEIFLSQPDVLLAGRYSDKATLSMLGAIGIRIEQFEITNALSQIPDQIRQMGEVLHQQTRAEQLAKEVEENLASLPAIDATAPVAAFYYPNGYSLGANTLGSDIVSAAGFRNLTQELGMTGGGRLDLEKLVLEEPDILISSPRYPGGSRSEDIMFHPAIAHYAENGRLIFSSSDWVCGTPITLRAVHDVARAHETLTQQEQSQ
jgi:iron complex transport system substrate-binding protein